MSTFEIANQRADNNTENNKIDSKTADEYAKNVIKQYEDDKAVEDSNTTNVHYESGEEPQHHEEHHEEHYDVPPVEHHEEPQRRAPPVVENTLTGFDTSDTGSYSPIQ